MVGQFFAPEFKKNDALGKLPNLRLLYAIVAVRKIRLAQFFVSDYHAIGKGPRMNTDFVSRMNTDQKLENSDPR